MLVPAQRTIVTAFDFTCAVLATHPDLSKEAIALLWAQYAGETGNGYACFGYNLGNVKWTAGCGLDYHALLGTWECYATAKAEALIESRMAIRDTNAGHACGAGCTSVVFSRENPITWFRSYPDLATAMRSFISMKHAGRFAGAWPFVLAGDCDGFAKEIGELKVRPGDKSATRYYTASVDAYAKLMTAKRDEWMMSGVWERALKAVRPGSHVPTQPIELALEGKPLVDMVSGETWLLDFDIVHPDVELAEPNRCDECGFISCRCEPTRPIPSE